MFTGLRVILLSGVILSLILFSSIIFSASAATTYYVSVDGNDSNDGLSWETAFATIQKGVDEANDGNSTDYAIVNVNTGTYTTGPITIDNNNLHLVFRNDVEVAAISNLDEPNTFQDYGMAVGDCLITMSGRENIIIDGNNTVFRMWKDEYVPNEAFNTNNVNIVNDTITMAGHGFDNGDKVRYYYATDLNAVEPLQKSAIYYIIYVDENTVQLATSYQKAIDGNNIDLTYTPSSQYHSFGGGTGRHVIKLLSCKNIEINNSTLKDSGGDGIFIGRIYGSQEPRAYNEDVEIRGVICDNNVRNAISVISVDGLTIEDCTLKNTKGSNPESGIDFEPGFPSSRLKDIVMSNNIITDNNQIGIVISPSGLDSTTADVNMIFENIYINNANKYGIYAAYIYDDAPSGTIDFNGVTVENANCGLGIRKSSQDIDLTFKNCVWKDSISKCIEINEHDDIDYPGGFEFIDCQVFDDQNRPVIQTADGIGNGQKDLYEVHGDLYAINHVYEPDLYDWQGAVTHNVDINVISGSTNFCKAFNRTKLQWYSSIQSAVDNSSDGDVIEVMPTTHYETVDFKGKAITLRSIEPSDPNVVKATIINANGSAYGVKFISSEDENSVLQGITITNDTEAGIYCGLGNAASPMIIDCIITDANDFVNYGIDCNSNAAPIVLNTIISGHQVGVHSTNASSSFKNCLIHGNSFSGMTFTGTSSPVVTNCTIVDNLYVGISKDDPNCSLTITNCIIWDCLDDLYNCSATYSCIEDGDDCGMYGNICSAPCFVDAGNDDYHLDPNSLCIDAGDPNGDYAGQGDIDGQLRVMVAGVDMGADEAAYLPSDHPDYNEWDSVGKPDCWCYQRQCHGDTDSLFEGKGSYWVSTVDFGVLIAAWNKSFEEIESQTYNDVLLICADFNHHSSGKDSYRVASEDLDILMANWNTQNKPDPNCFE